MEYLRGSAGGFTADSIQRRLPQILDSVVKHNPGYSATSLAALQVHVRASFPVAVV